MAGFSRKCEALETISREQGARLAESATEIDALVQRNVESRERLDKELERVENRFKVSVAKLSEFVEERFARQLAENRRKQTCLNRRKAEHVAIEKRMDSMDKDIESLRIDLFGEDDDTPLDEKHKK